MRGRAFGRSWTWLSAAVTFASIATASGAARAQVNAEALRRNVLQPGLSLNLDTTLAFASGNVELLDVGAGGRVQYQTLYPSAAGPGGQAPPPFIHHRVYIAGNGRYSDRGGVPVMSQSYLHVRWTGMWHPRLGSDVFVQYQNNRFFRLQRRSLAGAGARVEIVHEPAFLLWGGSAYMLEYELINVQPGAPDQPETLSHRWTNYLTGRLSLAGGRFLVQSTTYLQPRFDDFADFRLLEELEAQGRMTEILGFGLTLSVLHDSAPPTGVKNTDVRLASNVQLTF